MNKIRALAESSITARLVDDGSAAAAVRGIATVLNSLNATGQIDDLKTGNTGPVVNEDAPGANERIEKVSVAQQRSSLGFFCSVLSRHNQQPEKADDDGHAGGGLLSGRHTHRHYAYQTPSRFGSRSVAVDLAIWTPGSCQWAAPSRMLSSQAGSPRQAEAELTDAESRAALASGMPQDPAVSSAVTGDDTLNNPQRSCADKADDIPVMARTRKKKKGSVEESSGGPKVQEMVDIDWLRDPERVMKFMREAAKNGEKRAVQWREDKKNRVNKVLLHFHERGYV